MQIFKPAPYSTTKALLERVTGRHLQGFRGLGQSQLSMSNQMMLGMALGAVAFVVMDKKGMLPKAKAA
jgi:hypothetical protein